MKLFVIEGNIGAGKSTLLNALKATHPHIIIVQEPVDDWFKIVDPVSNKSLFELFYEDPKKYGYLFQTNVLMSRFKRCLHMLDTATEDSIVVCERSIMTDKHIFVAAAFEMNTFNHMEYQVFNQLYDLFIKISKFHVDGIVYLQCDPSVAYSRILNRNRCGEQTIPMHYVQILHDKHEDWLMHDEASAAEPHVHVVNNNTGHLNISPALVEFMGL
jgi:deoxyadenosine/deoxycytidine kinase